MKKKLNLKDFLILQAVVVIYTVSGVLGKLAAMSAEGADGWGFLLLYGAEIGVLGVMRFVAAGDPEGGAFGGVCQPGGGAFVVAFVGGIFVWGKDHRSAAFGDRARYHRNGCQSNGGKEEA